MTKQNKDVYQRITDQIVAAIERGVNEWRMPWHGREGRGTARPLNVVSRRAYRGVNVLALWAAAQEAGYPTGVWGTYRQWAELGAQVRRGERGTLVVFWKVYDRGAGDQDDAATPDEEREGSGRRRFLARGYTIFNATQVEASPLRHHANDRWSNATWPQSAFLMRSTSRPSSAAIALTISRARTASIFPLSKYSAMPPRRTPCGRMNARTQRVRRIVSRATCPAGSVRDLSDRFGSDAYAAEELVAELTAAFVCADLGLSTEPRPDHAAYIASWLKVLRGDKRAIFSAAAQAQRAADWMHEQQPDAAEIAEMKECKRHNTVSAACPPAAARVRP